MANVVLLSFLRFAQTTAPPLPDAEGQDEDELEEDEEDPADQEAGQVETGGGAGRDRVLILLRTLALGLEGVRDLELIDHKERLAESRSAPTPTSLPVRLLHVLDSRSILSQGAVHGLTSRETRRNEGLELHNGRRGELEGFEVGLKRFSARYLSHGLHDALICWTSSSINQEDLRTINSVHSNELPNKNFVWAARVHNFKTECKWISNLFRK